MTVANPRGLRAKRAVTGRVPGKSVIKSSTVPDLGRDGASSDSQRLRALQAANAIRIAQSRWRQRVHALEATGGRRYLANCLEDTDLEREIARLPLRRFLQSARALGPRKATEIMRAANVLRHDPRIVQLTTRERYALALELRRRADVTARHDRTKGRT